MQVSKIIGFILTASLWALLVSGCLAPEDRIGVVQPETPLSTKLGEPAEHQDSSVARRFQDASPQSRTAVESAVELLEKHAELSKQAAELERKNRSLMTENDRLKEQTTALEAESKQAQKELAEANDLLVEMRIELNNWKTSILGFRDEMREAESAQLEALLKILQILGGEVTVEAVASEDAEQPTAAQTSPHASDQAKAQETSVPGGPNG